MVLSWNEIKYRALKFSQNWQGAAREKSDAQSFLIDFLDVFGVDRRRDANLEKQKATFEYQVKRQDGSTGYIDFLWKGIILIEMKSPGEDMDKAFQQAKNYLAGLQNHELPKAILVSDFRQFRFYNLIEGGVSRFTLPELVDHVDVFGFLAGYQKRTYQEQDPANIKAAERMAKLHDRLKEIGYSGHVLEVYLVRILFCLFAEDTTIFTKFQFQEWIEQRTQEDGSDLAARLQELFQVLNTPSESRFTNLDEQLAAFPYVNGKLFEENLPTASFDRKMRDTLLYCCYLDWSLISPAIFGSMFQGVMNPEERRNLGAHYTSETNILKLIKPLFLDGLWEEFRGLPGNPKQLENFQKKLGSLVFLDPACGCGNFLVITYRELRLLELEVMKAIAAAREDDSRSMDVGSNVHLHVDQFFGIECEEFPMRIAEAAMWLIDHQMNMRLSHEFGEYYVRLPLRKSAAIVHGNALTLDWESIVPKSRLSYILGNPPFIGSRIMNAVQKEELTAVFNQGKPVKAPQVGDLDYVTAWYAKAAKYIHGTAIKAAFVSTNSIVQGLQTTILWRYLFDRYRIKIHFAHRTFKWSNEARGKAAVYCVIIGFAAFDTKKKLMYEYEDIRGEAHEITAKNINPYLVDFPDILIERQQTPICEVPEMVFGNMPADGGEFLFSTEEKNIFLQKQPEAEKYFKRLIGAKEYLNNIEKWCLWLIDIEPEEFKKMKYVLERVENVRKVREKSARPFLAKVPHLFAQITQPQGKDYVLIPSTTSENRKYIPMGFFGKDDIANNSCHIIPDASLYHFGVLTSVMHMTWVRYICGRLKSDYRYSKDIVYNNFPWPDDPGEKQIRAVEEGAAAVLESRSQFPGSSLAALYDPLTMPPVLIKAHAALDKAVDAAYGVNKSGVRALTSDTKRMEYLFDQYGKYTADLFSRKKRR